MLKHLGIYVLINIYFSFILTQFYEKDFDLRSEESHRRQCTLIEEDGSGKASKEYGINRNSILNQLSYFHVCNGGLLPDIMHDVLEGALEYEVKLLLRVLIEDENYFTLDNFNGCLENLEFGYMECKNRPTPISKKTLQSTGNSLKQSGM